MAHARKATLSNASDAVEFHRGFGLGIKYDLMAYSVSRYFGIRSYGAAYAPL